MTNSINGVSTTTPKYLRLHTGNSHCAYIFHHEEEWKVKFHILFNEH